MRITIKKIIAETADYFDITVDELTGESRNSEHTHPRQIAMWLCRRLTNHSYPHIGNLFHRDHTTVVYAVKSIAKKAAKEPDVKGELQEIVAILHGEEKRERDIMTGQVKAGIEALENEVTELSVKIRGMKEDFELVCEQNKALEMHRKKSLLRLT